MLDFYSQRDIKGTRKHQVCEGCGTGIPAGSPAYYFSQKYDGDFHSGYYHQECRAAEIALHRLHDLYWDECIALSDIETDDHAWLLAEHPIVAERLGIREPVQ